MYWNEKFSGYYIVTDGKWEGEVSYLAIAFLIGAFILFYQVSLSKRTKTKLEKQKARSQIQNIKDELRKEILQEIKAGNEKSKGEADS